ncbi:MAG: hypothetical protein CMQ54_02805 [Gammaproteobacteria bacterium]|nr:hypothetical protein [Gammaproteobacteria bacterium]|tara:strand:- start:1293 stop:1862 length:570 start_codon:yes stop_codon:yes gene_type:complete
MNEKKTTWVHLQILLIVSVFFAPLAVATWMYYGGYFDSPIQKTSSSILKPIKISDELPNVKILSQDREYWALIYSNRSECFEVCRNDLNILNQSHKILDKKINNIIQVFLHGESLPDRVSLSSEHKKLIIMNDYAFSSLLEKKTPKEMLKGGYFLMDPPGNLVMYFESKTNPSDIAEDIRNLLKKSHVS